MNKIIKAKVGSYNLDGKEKGIYRTVGSLRDGYILLDAHFNPAAIEREPGRDRIILSVFDEEERGSQDANTQTSRPQPARQQDDLPF
jgi:hypothetical protein